MIELLKITRSYRAGKNIVRALVDVNIEISQGEFVAIRGSSGSGKSTLLNIIGILDRYDSGSYRLDGHPMDALSETDAAHYRSRYIGFVFQAFNLIAFKTAAENVALPLIYQNIPLRQRNRTATEYLDKVGLANRADHLPSELSGGQMQRVAIARALATKPKVILADEPTGALDSENSEQIMGLLADANNDGVTVILVTHEDDVAAWARRSIQLRDGRVLSPDRDV